MITPRKSGTPYFGEKGSVFWGFWGIFWDFFGFFENSDFRGFSGFEISSSDLDGLWFGTTFFKTEIFWNFRKTLIFRWFFLVFFGFFVFFVLWRVWWFQVHLNSTFPWIFKIILAAQKGCATFAQKTRKTPQNLELSKLANVHKCASLAQEIWVMSRVRFLSWKFQETRRFGIDFWPDFCHNQRQNKYKACSELEPILDQLWSSKWTKKYPENH